MKNYTILATIAFAFFLVSCTADEPQTNAETTTTRSQQFDVTDMNAREGDSISLSGEPVKPKTKD